MLPASNLSTRVQHFIFYLSCQFFPILFQQLSRNFEIPGTAFFAVDVLVELPIGVVEVPSRVKLPRTPEKCPG